MRLLSLLAAATATVASTPAFAAEPVGFLFENPYYIADLTARQVRGKTEDNGKLRALVFKACGNLRIERAKNRMHWAPSFQRVGATGYNSIGTWDPVQQQMVGDDEANRWQVREQRKGYEIVV